MAHRDEIIAFADELLDTAAFRDYGPMGMQVIGAEQVTRVVCGVSASLELFQQAAAAGAQLVLVHHGLFWENEPRTIDARMKGRLRVLFEADITLAAYHLALDAHPEIGNNALLARELGVEIDGPFTDVGMGGSLRQPTTIGELAALVARVVDHEPLVFADGPDRVERVAIISGGGASRLAQAAAEHYDVLLTGEAAEPTMMTARELGIHFIAAGHYATERLGVQALAEKIAERFGIGWQFVELPNPV